MYTPDPPPPHTHTPTHTLPRALALLARHTLTDTSTVQYNYDDVRGADMRMIQKDPTADHVTLMSSVVLKNTMMASTLLFTALGQYTFHV